jgi:hypothetical protein
VPTALESHLPEIPLCTPESHLMSCATDGQARGSQVYRFKFLKIQKRLVLSLNSSSQRGVLGSYLRPDTRTVQISNGAKIATASFHQRDFDLRSRCANQKPIRFRKDRH